MADNSKDYGFMCQVLMTLAKKSETLWSEKRDLNGSDIRCGMRDSYEFMISSKHPITSKALEELINEGSRRRELCFDSKFYLPPLQDNSEFIPVFSLKCNLGSPSPKTSLRVEMYRVVKIGRGKETHCLGMRFEVHGNGSEHNYCHVQLSSEHRWKGSKDLLPNCPRWIPTEIPRIPLMADCPVSLIIALLVSFYGKHQTREMMKSIRFDGKYEQALRRLWSDELGRRR